MAENNSTVLTVYTGGKPTVLQEDLQLVSQWVKSDLFEKVKFLYDPTEELKVDRALFNLFVVDCKDRLVGLKDPKAIDGYRRLYVELLWQEASRKNTNLIASGLTTRRSSVYSAMQSRFVGKLTMPV